MDQIFSFIHCIGSPSKGRMLLKMLKNNLSFLFSLFGQQNCLDVRQHTALCDRHS